MADIALRKGNVGFFEVKIWKDKKKNIPMDVSAYQFLMIVQNERGQTIWEYTKTRYDAGDEPTQGFFRILYDTVLTSTSATHIFRIMMQGDIVLTVVEGNLVVV